MHSVHTAEMDEEEEKRLIIRVRCRNGMSTVFRNVNPKDTVSSLLTKFELLSQISPDQMVLLKGFPPRRINFKPDQLIETLDLQLKDTLLLESKEESKSQQTLPDVIPPRRSSVGCDGAEEVGQDLRIIGDDLDRIGFRKRSFSFSMMFTSGRRRSSSSSI